MKRIGDAPFFEGFYFKQQSNEQTLALIVAHHAAKGKPEEATLQVLTETSSLVLPLPPLRVGAAGCAFCEAGVFGPAGLRLAVECLQGSIAGTLLFSDLTPPYYDIMGPFALVPGMECRHSLRSLRHRVDGELIFNGKPYRFANAAGYAEGDSGRSFPSRYLWTQSLLGPELQDSVMLSVAMVPFLGAQILGTIASVWTGGREYRLATYLGARVEQIKSGYAKIVQGSDSLEVRLLEGEHRSLQAPVCGGMHRTVREGLCCKVLYRFIHHGHILLQGISKNASFEDEWGAG